MHVNARPLPQNSTMAAAAGTGAGADDMPFADVEESCDFGLGLSGPGGFAGKKRYSTPQGKIEMKLSNEDDRRRVLWLLEVQFQSL